jgi:hypothetical protein
MTINLAQISNLLRPGLAAVFGDYPDYPAQWTEIYEKHKSDKATEIEVELKMLGLARLKTEGGSITYDTMGQMYTTSYTSSYRAIGFIITRQAIMDNLYQSQFPMGAKAMKQSLLQTKEILAASIFNNGFDTAYPGGDGQPLFSSSHPITGGVVSNTFAVQADLSETALESGIIATQRYKDAAGLLKSFPVKKLLVPTENMFQSDRLLKSQFRVGTANNDINAVYNMSSVPMGSRVNQFLTDTNAWYLLTECDGAFKYYEREPIEVEINVADFDTKSLKSSAMERYAFGWSNFRGAFGCSGTA